VRALAAGYTYYVLRKGVTFPHGNTAGVPTPLMSGALAEQMFNCETRAKTLGRARWSSHPRRLS
jgi:hypothetical protein